MRTHTAAAAALGVLLLASCSSTGTVAPAPDGPAQDITLTGDRTIVWTSSDTPQGAIQATPPAQTPGTGCYTWTDAVNIPRWTARIIGSADGHSLVLWLEVLYPSPSPPLGAHSVMLGSHQPNATATLIVDGTAYTEVSFNPAAPQPQFTIDGDGTTGTVAIPFSATAGGPVAYSARGRWHCA